MISPAYLKDVVSVLQPCLLSRRVTADGENDSGCLPSHGEPTAPVRWVANNVVRPVLEGKWRVGSRREGREMVGSLYRMH